MARKSSSLGFLDGRAPKQNHDHGGYREGRGGSHDAVPADTPRSRPVGHRSNGNGFHINSAGGTRTIPGRKIKTYLGG